MMHASIPPEDFESPPNYKFPDPEALDWSHKRRVFRQMLKDELAEQPLTPAKRREYVKFAKRLGLDDFEANLYIRAVEYECGYQPPPPDANSDSHAQLGYAGTSDTSWQAWMTAAILVALMVMFLILDVTFKR